MKLYTGTSGFSYKEWKGPFYPEDLPQKKFLSFYATQLGTVEINNTFYRLPKAELIAGWAEKVPDDFRFIIKASRKITHFQRLKPESSEVVEYLFKTISGLGVKLGAVLFQLPPNFKRDDERLSTFIDSLPKGTRAAFEFRHVSWFEEDVYVILRNAGIALVGADIADGKGAPVVSTADWGYLRLRREEYSDADLKAWRKTIEGHGWERAFVFFKHEDAGSGPIMAKRFGELPVS